MARELGGDPAAAEPLFRRAMEIDTAKLLPGYPALVTAETRLGESLVEQGKPELAEPLLRDAVAGSRKPAFPFPIWQAAESESALGVCLAKLSRWPEGAPLLDESRTALTLEPQYATRRWVLTLRRGTERGDGPAPRRQE
jgi:hypothetical protein